MATVLLVDDADDIRLLSRAVLQMAGHVVVEADSGAAALGLLEDARPDAVVLDIQMPGMDGWDTLAQLRADPSFGDVPVIVCSVKAAAQDEARAWQLGCDGYLVKPFDIAELVDQVSSVLARSSADRASARLTARSAVLEQATPQAP